MDWRGSEGLCEAEPLAVGIDRGQIREVDLAKSWCSQSY